MLFLAYQLNPLDTLFIQNTAEIEINAEIVFTSQESRRFRKPFKIL